jgi:hypothetical protein
MHRQGTEKESGLAAACSEALRKLNELLESEKVLLQQQNPGAGHSANIEAVTNEIKKVKKLAGIATSDGQVPKQSRRGPQPASERKGPRNPGRNTGGRRSGRRGER